MRTRRKKVADTRNNVVDVWQGDQNTNTEGILPSDVLASRGLLIIGHIFSQHMDLQSVAVTAFEFIILYL